MDKKPLTIDFGIDIDDKPLDRAIEKTNRLIDSIKEADRLIREINGINIKTEPTKEKEANN